MTDQEKFQAVFGRLHASADTMTEVKKAMNHETNRKPRRLTKKAVTLALAAVLLLALGAGAYAAGLFGMNVRPATEEELQPGSYYIRDEEGNWDYEAGPQLPADGLTFTWDGDTPVYKVEFRPGWLPAFPNHVWRDGVEVRWNAEDWQTYLWRDRGQFGSYGDLGVQYQISLYYAEPGKRMTLWGEYQTVETETWDDLSVTKVEMLYMEERGPENYVILFSESQGYMVVIGGSDDLETLEHIARELEIRQTDELAEPGQSGWGMLNIGRG